jgi:alpha-tubulin suppressor-like RCC1 family protein
MVNLGPLLDFENFLGDVVFAQCGGDDIFIKNSEGKCWIFSNAYNSQVHPELGADDKWTADSLILKDKDVHLGSYFMICVDQEGYVYSAGYNDFGQLGNGNKLAIGLLTKVKEYRIPWKISAVKGHRC